MKPETLDAIKVRVMHNIIQRDPDDIQLTRELYSQADTFQTQRAFDTLLMLYHNQPNQVIESNYEPRTSISTDPLGR